PPPLVRREPPHRPTLWRRHRHGSIPAPRVLPATCSNPQYPRAPRHDSRVRPPHSVLEGGTSCSPHQLENSASIPLTAPRQTTASPADTSVARRSRHP